MGIRGERGDGEGGGRGGGEKKNDLIQFFDQIWSKIEEILCSPKLSWLFPGEVGPPPDCGSPKFGEIRVVAGPRPWPWPWGLAPAPKLELTELVTILTRPVYILTGLVKKMTRRVNFVDRTGQNVDLSGLNWF